jgi:hypothetical protein
MSDIWRGAVRSLTQVKIGESCEPLSAAIDESPGSPKDDASAAAPRKAMPHAVTPRSPVPPLSLPRPRAVQHIGNPDGGETEVEALEGCVTMPTEGLLLPTPHSRDVHAVVAALMQPESTSANRPVIAGATDLAPVQPPGAQVAPEAKAVKDKATTVLDQEPSPPARATAPAEAEQAQATPKAVKPRAVRHETHETPPTRDAGKRRRSIGSPTGPPNALDVVLASRQSTIEGSSIPGTTREGTVQDLRLFSEALFFAGSNDLARLKRVLKQVWLRPTSAC